MCVLNQLCRGLKQIKAEECVCRTNDFSPSTTETTVCEPRQIQGQRLQNPDCNRCGCQVSSSGMRSWDLRLLSINSSTSYLVLLQRFGYSNGPGGNQPQHPRTSQDLHPQSWTNGKSGWTTFFFLSRIIKGWCTKHSSRLLGYSSSAGRNGVSVTLVTQYDIHLVHSIEEQTRELDPIGTCSSHNHATSQASQSLTRVWQKDFVVSAETKLKEFPVEEKEVLKILTQVNVTRRECEIVRLPFSFLFILVQGKVAVNYLMAWPFL